MATAYSDQQTKKRALEAGTAYELTNGLNTDNGKLVTKVWTYTTTALASGSDIVLGTIPKGARVVRGQLITGAMGGSVTSAVGTDVALVKEDGSTALTAAGTAYILAATSTAAASNTAIAATRLLGAGGLTTAPTTFTIRTGGATLDAGIEVVVILEYLQS